MTVLELVGEDFSHPTKCDLFLLIFAILNFAKIRELYFASIHFHDSRKKVNKRVFNFAIL